MKNSTFTFPGFSSGQGPHGPHHPTLFPHFGSFDLGWCHMTRRGGPSWSEFDDMEKMTNTFAPPERWLDTITLDDTRTARYKGLLLLTCWACVVYTNLWHCFPLPWRVSIIFEFYWYKGIWTHTHKGKQINFNYSLICTTTKIIFPQKKNN